MGSGLIPEGDGSVGRCPNCAAVYRIDTGEIEVSGAKAKDVAQVLRAVKDRQADKQRHRASAIVFGAACVVLSGLLINLLTSGGWQGMLDKPV